MSLNECIPYKRPGSKKQNLFMIQQTIPTISSLKRSDGTGTQDSTEMAETFNNYALIFKIIFTLSDDTTVPRLQPNHIKYHPLPTLIFMLILALIDA